MTIQNRDHVAGKALESGNIKEAIRLLRPLAEENNAYALLSLGWIYQTGAAGDIDLKAARDFFERAAAQGSASAFFYLGQHFLVEEDRAQARTAFESGAKLGNDECKSGLEKLNHFDNEKLAQEALESGKFEESVRLLQPLADENREYALLSLGWIYETGAIGDPDWNKARSFYEKAAAQGSASAYLELGRLFLREGKEAQARSALEAGAERGDIACMSRLGRMMVEGRGGPADLVEGLAWLERAAVSGHIHAQRTLLAIEGRNARTVFEKLSVMRKIAALVVRSVRKILKDPDSDNFR